ncbi:hypothetical protein TorRG33x02_321580 [Trema orientale]|uniref:Uncharacterized protein n=1 Tax=Trema orientale TaxID=63057 RepID=A0A2P5BGT9_TREOI|nr:hypothetical protein TorRG33x02_321580 [Trema orientale]
MGATWRWESGACLRRVRRDMGRAMSGWEARESSRAERERELGGGFVRRAVTARWVAVLRWFERQRRGRRRLILVSSSWVRVTGFDDEEENGAIEGWKRRS